MTHNFSKMMQGYRAFRKKYASGDQSVMQSLADNGQKPETMVISYCDSRVDPALILQCDPGDLFVVRNVANIVPPHEVDDSHHGTSAALEFGVRFLKIRHLILLGHSQCGGVLARVNKGTGIPTEYIDNWVSLIPADTSLATVDAHAKASLRQSERNCLTFPWIQAAVNENSLKISLWFFDIKKGEIFAWSEGQADFQPL